jgi:uncharacterized protein
MGAGALEIVLLGLAAGVLVGLMGVGGGIVVVPMLVHLIGFRQHLAQGTSLFLLLPPIGLGALREYWKSGDADLRAGIICACGALAGGYGGSKDALLLSAQHLKVVFGAFLIAASVLLLVQSRAGASPVGSGRAVGLK